MLVATLNVNIGANVVSPSNDFSNLAPRLISFRTGGLITGFLGLAMMPWKLMSTFGTYIFGWLVGYSGLLGPVAGIMVADYFMIRGTQLDVVSLYHRGGPYEYSRGFNPRAIAALVAGVFVALLVSRCRLFDSFMTTPGSLASLYQQVFTISSWCDISRAPSWLRHREWIQMEAQASLCHPERSRGICSSAGSSWKCFWTEYGCRLT